MSDLSGEPTAAKVRDRLSVSKEKNTRYTERFDPKKRNYAEVKEQYRVKILQIVCTFCELGL